MKQVEISVVLPAFNEEEVIGDVLNQLQEPLSNTGRSYEIIVIDDGSTDGTSQIIEQKRGIDLIKHSYNRGYGSALKNGIKRARGEFILIMDADGTYSPTEIPKLVSHMRNYDMVVGARTGKLVKIPVLRRPGKWVLSMLSNYLTGVKIPDLNSGLRVFRKEDALRFFNILPDRFSFTTTITLAFLSNEYTIEYVPIDYHGRQGKSKISPIRDGLGFVLLILKTITYFNPLKIFLPISGVVFLTGLSKLVYDITFLKNVAEVSVILIVTGLQIMFFGLLADLIVKRQGMFKEHEVK